MASIPTSARRARSTRSRGRWSWPLLLAFGACGFPTYGGFGAGPRDAGPPDAGSDACSGADCPAGCAAGLGDCNGKLEDGCETTLTSLQDCGECGVACGNEHGTTTCANASAQVAACVPVCAVGFADCDLNPSNGCETNINTDSTHCGRCDLACPGNGGTASCQGGKCGVSSCNPGFGDCQNVGACGENLQTDPKNCGACGHVCSSSHATPRCNAGRCQLDCAAGWGDCNAVASPGATPPDDGCETKLNVPDSNGSVPNCGACGALCARRAYTTIDLAQCAVGTCARDCFPDEGDCNDNRNDPSCLGSGCGCDTYLGDDTKNCGGCGHVCKGGGCRSAACDCPDSQPKSGSTSCTLSSSVKCGPYGAACTCSCSSGIFKCTDSSGKAC